jgi:sugar phosphate isomerase/epimerase
METRRTFCVRALSALPAIGFGSLTSAKNTESTPPVRIAIGAETLPYSEFSLERSLEGIRKAGYRHATISFQHEKRKLLYGDMPGEEKKWLKRVLAESGLTIQMGLIGWDLNVTVEDGRSEYKRQLDLFAEFGIPFGLTGGPWRYIDFPHVRKPMPEWKKECDVFLKGLEPVADHAHSLGITLVMKPHTGLTATAWDCLELVERLQWPALKIAWDDGNVSFYEGLRPDTDLPYVAPHVRAWCIKDHRGERGNADFPIPGEGEIDFKNTLSTLVKAGFDGPACVERVDGTTPKAEMSAEEIDRRLAKACRNMTGIVESLG